LMTCSGTCHSSLSTAGPTKKAVCRISKICNQGRNLCYAEWLGNSVSA
jgi:hypothetical protein